MNQINQKLIKLGLTEYEAKAYIALLRKSPVNGSVLSKNSGIPRSRIYDVLENMLEKGLVFRSVEDSSSFYPLDIKMFYSRKKLETGEIISSLQNEIEIEISPRPKARAMKLVKGRDLVIDIAKNMINNANNRLVMYIWADESDILEKLLTRARKRGVYISGIAFGDFSGKTFGFHVHRRPKRVLSEINERWLIVIQDSDEMLTAVMSGKDDSRGTLTGDSAYIKMFEDYILHDILLNILLDEFTGEQRERFEKKLDEIRAAFRQIPPDLLEG